MPSELESVRASQRRSSLIRSLRGEADNNRTISKEDFVENYPLFLIQVMSAETDGSLMYSMRNQNNPGVDICFKSLSLSVKGLDRTINVVDDVTGRIQSKTMTALVYQFCDQVL